MRKDILHAFSETVIFFIGMAALDFAFSDEFKIDGTRMFLALGFFAYALISRLRRESKLAKKREHYLDVIRICHDKTSAEAICHKLKTHNIDAIVIPLYNNSGDETIEAQVLVYRKDYKKAYKITNSL